MTDDPRTLLDAYELTYQGGESPWPDDPDGGALRMAHALRAALDVADRVDAVLEGDKTMAAAEKRGLTFAIRSAITHHIGGDEK